jgi:hypothetical protein
VIVTAAILIALIYAWRYYTSHSSAGAPLGAQSLAGIGPLVSPEGFLIAWGVVFLTLSTVASFAPGFANAFALLLLVADVLANGYAVSRTTRQAISLKTEPAPTVSPRQRAEQAHKARIYGTLLAQGE